jgi:erythromycin esterase-like protein
MIIVLGASAIILTAMQASIQAPTSAFRGCLHTAVDKAKADKVAGDAIEAYLRNACTTEMSTLKEALIGFRMKNGMTRKAAISDADMTVDDYVSTPVDNYKFTMKTANAAAPAAAPAAPAAQTQAAASALKPATPAPTPASVPATQPQKQ